MCDFRVTVRLFGAMVRERNNGEVVTLYSAPILFQANVVA